MMEVRESWTVTHDLVLIYLSLAHATDHLLRESELEQIIALAEKWHDQVQPIRDVVMEALAVYLEGDSTDEVTRSMRMLHQRLSEEEHQEVLQDLVRIAEADGVLLGSESNFITSLGSIWGIKSDAQQMLEESEAPKVHGKAWSMLHDIGLMYLVMAHSTDNRLTTSELEEMLDRMGAWNPNLDEQRCEDILREALEVYAQEPSQRMLHTSMASIQKQLPAIQRLALLDDLNHIACVDGPIDENETELLTVLSKAWKLGIRLQKAPVS